MHSGKQAIEKHSKAMDERRKIVNPAVFVKRVCLDFLQKMYSQNESGHFKYDPDDSKTEIQICDQHAVNLSGQNIRPAIVALRGPVSSQGLGLGNGSMENRHVPTGKTTYNDLLLGSVAFSCYSTKGIEAENIAYHVFNCFKVLKNVVKGQGLFHVHAVNLGSEALVESGATDELYMVPVYVSLQVGDRWSIDDKGARELRQIIIECMNSF